jgi:hypothetical protein
MGVAVAARVGTATPTSAQRGRCPGQLSRRQDGDHVGRNGDRGGEDGGHGRGGSPAKILNIQI